MSVEYIRPEVERLCPVYKAIRDVIAGASVVKAARTTYLPMPDAADPSSAHRQARYKAYIDRAIFFEATGRTHEGYVGQMFYRETQVELIPLLQVMIEDVDGSGTSLYQQSKDVASEVLALGRQGLYVDYNGTSEVGATVADQEQGKVRPTITRYAPENIINWRHMSYNNQRVLCLVVLREEYDAEDDGFEPVSEVQFRVLKMVRGESGLILEVSVWRLKENQTEPVTVAYPTKGDGSHWDQIPFEFIGSINNDPEPDKPPLEGMVELNLGHYRNSADYEESVFMLSQPTPWASGITENWLKEAWDGELRLGSREFIPLPAGGQMGLLQMSPNNEAKAAMELKEKQMMALGAKIAENKSVATTATEENRNSVIENSVLSSVAKNVSLAYTRALVKAASYAGDYAPKVVFEINTDFEITRLSAQDRQQLLAEWQGGGITWEEYRWNIKRSGIAYQDDKKAQAIIKEELFDDAPPVTPPVIEENEE